MSGLASSLHPRPGGKAVLIAGPTASGKSAIALALAEQTAGIIINADSMQVYRDLRIMTARPSPSDEARAPHRLYGHVDAAENYSAGRWLRDAEQVLDDVRTQGRLAILVGGTGLYFKLLTEGIARIPPIPASVRSAIRARIEERGSPALYAELQQRDPRSAARLYPEDRSRIVRALEVIETTGRSLVDWQAENAPPVLGSDAILAHVFLSPERKALAAAIDARFEKMIATGALEEVRALGQRRLDPLLPAMKAHGVPWLLRHLAGEISLAEAVGQGQSDTRRYAKRQFTWFRNQLADWTWLEPSGAREYLVRAVENAGINSRS